MSGEDEIGTGAVWTGLRNHWMESAKKERGQREKWKRLKGWKLMGDHPKDGTRFLMRHLQNLPFPAYVDESNRIWAFEAGDVWPQKETEGFFWREMPEKELNKA